MILNKKIYFLLYNLTNIFIKLKISNIIKTNISKKYVFYNKYNEYFEREKIINNEIKQKTTNLFNYIKIIENFGITISPKLLNLIINKNNKLEKNIIDYNLKNQYMNFIIKKK